MIRTELEYKKTVERIQVLERRLIEQQHVFTQQGLNHETVNLALDPERSFLETMREDLSYYEQLRRGVLGTLYRLSDLGRWLIGIRIARGLSQKALAELLGVSEAQVSRDERNEYHGITLERAQNLLEKMGVQYHIEESVSGSLFQADSRATDSLSDGTTKVNMPLPVATAPIGAYLRADRRLSPAKADQLNQLIQQAIALAESD